MDLPTTRRIGAIDGTGQGCVLEQPLPEVVPGTVLVRVHCSLISPGTELTGARTARAENSTDAGAPKPFGYQNAGVVAAVGPETDTDLTPGTRVACIGAGYAQHTDYAVVPVNLCAPLPDNVSFEQGAYTHLAMTALHAVRRAEPRVGEYLLTVGLGLVGQMASRIAQIAGCYTMGWDMVPFRCEVARDWGIDATTVIGREDPEERAQNFTNGFGFDRAVVAFGGEGTEALNAVSKVMKLSRDTHRMGRISLVGGLKTVCAWGAGLGNLDLVCSARTGPGYHDEPWEHDRVAYPPVFMRWTTASNMALCLRWMAEGKLDVDALTTHKVPLDAVDDMVSAHIDTPDGTLGTLLMMGDADE